MTYLIIIRLVDTIRISPQHIFETKEHKHYMSMFVVKPKVRVGVSIYQMIDLLSYFNLTYQSFQHYFKR
jgi:hypothetical protein